MTSPTRTGRPQKGLGAGSYLHRDISGSNGNHCHRSPLSLKQLELVECGCETQRGASNAGSLGDVASAHHASGTAPCLRGRRLARQRAPVKQRLDRFHRRPSLALQHNHPTASALKPASPTKRRREMFELEKP